VFADLIPLLRCPRSDRGRLALEDARPDDPHIETGVLRCARCGNTYPVRDGVPLLLTEPLRSEVERKTGDRMSAQFAQYQTKATKAVAKLLDRLTPQAGVVLDLGSGRAPYLDVLRGDVICVDLFPPFLTELGSRSVPGRRVHAVCASAIELPFPEAVADVVFASELIEHLSPEEADRALQMWPRYARSWCIIDTPNGHEDTPITRLRHLVYRTTTLTEEIHVDLPELDHHSTFSPADFERAGYRVHGCIGWVSRERFPLGPLWDVYDDIAWRLPQIGGTLVAVRRGTGRVS
jgi:uncharacterized protein YbaR (Trm112 family)